MLHIELHIAHCTASIAVPQQGWIWGPSQGKRGANIKSSLINRLAQSNICSLFQRLKLMLSPSCKPIGLAHSPSSAPLEHCTFNVQLRNGALYMLLMISMNCSASAGLSLGANLG